MLSQSRGQLKGQYPIKKERSSSYPNKLQFCLCEYELLVLLYVIIHKCTRALCNELRDNPENPVSSG
jgi:hypothetical protein